MVRDGVDWGVGYFGEISFLTPLPSQNFQGVGEKNE